MMVQVLDWQVPGDGMGIRVLVDSLSEDEVRDTPLKSHIISTVLAQLIEAVDIVEWQKRTAEVQVVDLFENLETALDILKIRLHDAYGGDSYEGSISSLACELNIASVER